MNGIMTVAGLEFRLRLRTGKWRLLLLIWFLILLGIASLIRASIRPELFGVQDIDYTGSIMFGGLMLVVLALALLIAPTLSAQSVNGDRERGTLAPLQITGLTSWHLTLGKLAASWGTGVVFLLVTVPLTVWAMVEGGLGLGRVLVVYLVMALLIGVVCALSLALSALLSRTTTSSVLSYLMVFALTAGTGLLFALGIGITSEEVDGGDFSYSEPHPEKVWWLLAPNPFVILADSAPYPPETTITLPDGEVVGVNQDADLLGGLSRGVRTLRVAPEDKPPFDASGEAETGAPVWPVGLGVQLVLAAAALVLTERRLRTPSGTLPKGQRVA